MIKAVAAALVLIAGAAIVLWYGNMLNSWIVGGLIGGLAALLLSVPISLVIFSYLSHRYGRNLFFPDKDEVEQPVTFVPSDEMYAQLSAHVLRHMYEMRDESLLPTASATWEDEEDEVFRAAARHYLPPSSARFADERWVPDTPPQHLEVTGELVRKQEVTKSRGPATTRHLSAKELEVTKSRGSATTRHLTAKGSEVTKSRPATTRHLMAKGSEVTKSRGPATTRRLTEKGQEPGKSRGTFYPGFPVSPNGLSQSQLRMQALRTARLEATQHYVDDGEIRELSFEESRRLITDPDSFLSQSQPGETGSYRSMPPHTYEEPEHVTTNPDSFLPQPQPGETGPYRPITGRTYYGAKSKRIVDASLSANEFTERQTNPADGPATNSPQTDPVDFSTDSLRKPLLRRAPYMYDDDPLRQELSQQLEPPTTRRSSRKLVPPDELPS